MGKLSWVLLIPAISFCSNVTGQDRDLDHKWLEKFSQLDFEQTTECLNEYSNIWPNLPSLEIIDEQFSVENGLKKSWHEIALGIPDKLKKYDDQFPEDYHLKPCEKYIQFARSMRKSGGYTNLILANLAEKLVIDRISVFLISNPEEHKKAEEALSKMSQNSLIDKQFKKMVMVEAGSKNHDIETVELKDILSILEIKFNTLISDTGHGQTTTSQLLKSKDISTLLWRYIVTRTPAQAHVPTYIEFLEKGGSYSEDLLENCAPWYEIMGQKGGKHGCPEIGLNSLGPDNVGIWIKEYQDGYRNNAHYEIFVE